MVATSSAAVEEAAAAAAEEAERRKSGARIKAPIQARGGSRGHGGRCSVSLFGQVDCAILVD